MTDRELVVVGLSGGVDSALAARLAQREGKEVVGVFLHQWDVPDAVARRCCSQADCFDARAVADELDIPFVVLDAKEIFRSEVVSPFVEGYLKGTTPNPCVTCNERVKLLVLASKALELRAKALVTGHYARVLFDPDAQVYRLFRGVDPRKDQSYFLYRLPQQTLRMLNLPLGVMTKDAVRRLAGQDGLSIASKPDSQQLCFLGALSAGEFVERFTGMSSEASGDIVGPFGDLLGRHCGVFRFTVGQRRGIGVCYQEPLYVSRIEPHSQRVFVAPKDGLFSKALRFGRASWVWKLPHEGKPYEVQVRAHHSSIKAVLREVHADGGWLELLEPVFAVAPGQSAVLYDGEEVLGGGVIEEAVPAFGQANHPPAMRS